MSEMPEHGPMMADISHLVAFDVGGDPNGAFLYIEIVPGAMGMALFKELDDKVVSMDISRSLIDKIWEVWYAVPEKDRWSSLQLSIAGDQFDVKLGYEDLADEEVDGLAERQTAVMKQRFGDKPVEYPDWEDLTDPDASSFTLGTSNGS